MIPRDTSLVPPLAPARLNLHAVAATESNACGIGQEGSTESETSLLRGFALYIASTLLLLILSRVLGHANAPFYSLLGVIIAGIIALWFGVKLLHIGAVGSVWVGLFIAAYVARVSLGIVFYLVAVDSSYFAGAGNFPAFNWEFYYTHANMVLVSNAIAANGLANGLTNGLPATFFVENKNAFIQIFGGIFYYLAQPFALNIAVWNSFHHVWTGILIVVLARHCCIDEHASLKAGVIAAFIPWGFASSVMWRDSVGQTWLIIAAVLTLAAIRKRKLAPILLPAAIWFAWSNRFPYAFVVAICFVAFRSTQDETEGKVQLARLAAGIFAAAVIGLNMGIVRDYTGIRYSTDTQMITSIVTYPLRIFKAVMGPFPWFQYLDRGAESIYVIFDLAQHVFSLSVFLALILACKRRLFVFNYLNVFGLFILGLGILAPGTHTAYLAPGIPLLLPQITEARIRLSGLFFVSLLFFLFANLVYAFLGLWGTGTLQSITGY